MSDTQHNKTRFRTFNAIDGFNRAALGIDVGTGIPATRISSCLDQLAAWHGYSERIQTSLRVNCFNIGTFTE